MVGDGWRKRSRRGEEMKRKRKKSWDDDDDADDAALAETDDHSERRQAPRNGMVMVRYGTVLVTSQAVRAVCESCAGHILLIS